MDVWRWISKQPLTSLPLPLPRPLSLPALPLSLSLLYLIEQRRRILLSDEWLPDWNSVSQKYNCQEKANQTTRYLTYKCYLIISIRMLSVSVPRLSLISPSSPPRLLLVSPSYVRSGYLVQSPRWALEHSKSQSSRKPPLYLLYIKYLFTNLFLSFCFYLFSFHIFIFLSFLSF